MPRTTREVRWIAAALIAAACGSGPGSAPRRTVDGLLPPIAAGDAYLFLYEPGEGPPQRPGPPRFVTAVSQERLLGGDGRFVFSGVPDGDFRLWGFLDADRSFRLDAELLAQPDEGDRPFAAETITVEEGLTLETPLSLLPAEPADPPAFALDGDLAERIIPDLSLQPVTFSLRSTRVAGLGGGGFEVSLADANGDGASEDADGDTLPDLFPQVFLRFLPRPGQTVPTDAQGRAAEVIVPLRFLPGAFLAVLGGDVTARVKTDTLDVVMVPQAVAVFRAEGGRRLTISLEAIPVGSWELVVLSERGQLWRIPNPLGENEPSQAVRFTVAHGSGLTRP